MKSSLLWQPHIQRMAQSHLAHFMQYINERYLTNMTHYNVLHRWSVEHPALFWQGVWDFCGVVASKPSTIPLQNKVTIQKSLWFQGAALNFAENLLKHAHEQHPAIIFTSESGVTQTLSFIELRAEVAALAAYLKKLGLGIGDHVAGFLPNQPETIVAMLAVTSLGAVWSSCSPDFGFAGLLDRFQQVQPKILFATDQHTYNGKTYAHLEKIQALQASLTSIQNTILISQNKNSNILSLKKTQLYTDCILDRQTPLVFTPCPFNHPLYILFSSGTTGKPKCIVHSVGGTLLQHLKELVLHCDLHLKERLFFYTTCGWMMWNWMVSALALGTTLILYDGSPFYPAPTRLFDLIDQMNINVFGVSAKFLETCEKNKLAPKNSHQLHRLRSILTTGSPLLPESFDYVYQAIKTDVQLSSISGGSDIISCFALGNPLLPVYRGELQCIGLGMDVKIFNPQGEAVVEQKGELVCASPFPSMPIYFLNDPDGMKYQQAYFNQFPTVWTHGDYASLSWRGGMIIYGRSDTTLNPGGIRIGTAEIYRPLEKISAIKEALAVGQHWQGGERIILFVVLKEPTVLNDAMIDQIKQTIRSHASPHHLPAKIIQVPDLPKTFNGKIAELTVKKIIQHEKIDNLTALANPESVDYFIDISATLE